MVSGQQGPVLNPHRCAVLGSPITHSLSPVLHQAGYAYLGLDWSYQAIEVGAGQLARFVAGLDYSWRGLSLTMPLKAEALALGAPSAVARLTGVANTLVFTDGRPQVSNTDAPGLADALRLQGVREVSQAVILGSGATAKSALVGLAQLGLAEVVINLRTPARAAELCAIAAALGVELRVKGWSVSELTAAPVYVSTVTAGAADLFAAVVAEHSEVVFDVIYDPWPTALANAATAAGCLVLGGLDLLVSQAVLQLEAMTGHLVPAEVLRSAGRAELTRRMSS